MYRAPDLSFWSPLIFIGIYAATLSSAIASLVGAPRILMSVARDDIIPWCVKAVRIRTRERQHIVP